jgi:hypothetical protein
MRLMFARAALLAVLAALLSATATAPAGAALTRERAVAIGSEAYEYGLPLLEFLRVRREMTSVRAPDGRTDAPINVFGNARAFAGPEDRTVVAPNVDTLYSIAHLDLGGGPVVLEHPDMGRRYFVFQLLDPYTNTFAYVGSRTTGSKGGRFAITWSGRPEAAPEGVRVIRSASRRVWVIGRTLVRGERDLAPARALMKRYRLVALSRLGRPPRRRAPGDPGRVVRSPTPGGVAFLDALGDALAGNPPPAHDRAVLRRLAAAGIGPGRHPSKAGLPAAVLAGLVEGLDRARAQLPVQARTQILRAALASGGWYVSPPGIGAYGTDYLLRARIAIVGLGANTPQEAVYPVALTDSAGRLLNGSQRYRITFAKGRAPPVRAFWSLTVYDADGFLVANPARRYAVGDSHPPLVRRPDGSIVIAVQRDRPAQRDVNWLPAPPGGFRLSLRLYQPVRSILRGAWTPPPVRRLPASAP